MFSRGRIFVLRSQSCCKMVEVVRSRLRAWINEILQQLASQNLDSGSQESVFYRVETLYNIVVRFDGVLGIDGNIVSQLREGRDVLSSHNLSFPSHMAYKRIFTAQRGSPKYMLPQE